MTDQPRDLAAEVERIRLEVSKQFEHVANRDNCLTLLAQIAAISRELELQREAIAFLARNTTGVFYTNAVPINPPEHLRDILAKALEGK